MQVIKKAAGGTFCSEVPSFRSRVVLVSFSPLSMRMMSSLHSRRVRLFLFGECRTHIVCGGLGVRDSEHENL